MSKNTIIGILIAIVAVLMTVMFKSCRENNQNKVLIEALNDSIEFSYDKLGRQSATISNLEAINEETLLKLESNDSTINWLKDVVKDFQGKLQLALVLSNTTSSSGTTNTIVRIDTVTNYPIYSTSWKSQWDEGFIEATKDSIKREIRIKNEYEFTIGTRSNKWFKPAESNVSIRNLNPNTLTNELRSFTIRERTKNLGIGLHAGIGITGDLTLSPYLGVGIDYRLLSIK